MVMVATVERAGSVVKEIRRIRDEQDGYVEMTTEEEGQ